MVLFDHLSDTEQQTLAAIGNDPDCYGILRPRTDPHLTIKSVSRDTALLFLTLQVPSFLPHYVLAELGESYESVIGKMVLDGILEVEADGAMHSGPGARHLVFEQRDLPERIGPIAALSRRALEYAALLGITDAAILSARLYSYNRIPENGRWRRILSDSGAVEAYVGLQDDAITDSLRASWARLPAESTGGWIGWQSLQRTRAGNAGSITYKLYISPACDDVGSSFRAAVRVLSQSAAFHWKVGNDLHGLLRPDKIVAYFSELSDLQVTAATLLEKLQGCKPQGVPFTADIGGTGLLSWGVDPPAEDTAVPWLARESWRARICNRLASALVLAGPLNASGVSVTQFATERLALDGINTGTWTPVNVTEWRAPAAI